MNNTFLMSLLPRLFLLLEPAAELDPDGGRVVCFTPGAVVCRKQSGPVIF